MKYLVCFLYLVAVVAANLSATYFGMWATPFNALFLIGLEMTARDYLHTKLTHVELVSVVFLAGVVSFLLNTEAVNIAIASSTAIIISCLIDYLVFHNTKGTWFKRSNTSNVFSATSDSLIFPTIAFGVLNIWVVILHIFMKVFGGFIWSLIFVRFLKKRKTFRHLEDTTH